MKSCCRSGSWRENTVCTCCQLGPGNFWACKRCMLQSQCRLNSGPKLIDKTCRYSHPNKIQSHRTDTKGHCCTQNSCSCTAHTADRFSKMSGNSSCSCSKRCILDNQQHTQHMMQFLCFLCGSNRQRTECILCCWHNSCSCKSTTHTSCKRY